MSSGNDHAPLKAIALDATQRVEIDDPEDETAPGRGSIVTLSQMVRSTDQLRDEVRAMGVAFHTGLSSMARSLRGLAVGLAALAGAVILVGLLVWWTTG